MFETWYASVPISCAEVIGDSISGLETRLIVFCSWVGDALVGASVAFVGSSERRSRRTLFDKSFES